MNIRFSKEVPFNDRYEVIVIGGGPSGCAAAVAAARGGASVLLLEATGALGGMGTSGLIPAWCPFSDGTKVIYRGIALEVFEKAKASMKHVKSEDTDWVPIDAEALKRVYDEIVGEAGVTVLFHTQAVSVVAEEQRIDYIAVANKAGITAFRGRVYVDCTGDADMAAMAGLPFEYGDERTHEVQPATHCFTLTNVDEYHYQHLPFLHMSNPDCAVYDIAKSDRYPLITGAHCCNSLLGPRTIGFNAGHIWNVNSTDPLSVSKALMTGRQLAYQFHQGLKEYLPETYAASHLTATAALMGIRDSRRIIGEYKITLDDYIQRRSFPDEIGRNCYFLDVHYTKEERDRVMKGESNGEEGREAYSAGESHGIPYRSLIPKGIDNLLVAGRSIACDHKVQGSVRVMPVCLVTGQAAGTAAQLACEAKGASESIEMRNIDIDYLRSRLQKDGAYFE